MKAITPIALAIIIAIAVAISASTNAVEDPPVTTRVETSAFPTTEAPIAPSTDPVETTPSVETIDTKPETEEPVTTAAPETEATETMVEYDPWEHIPLDDEVKAHVVSLCAEKGIEPEIVFAMIWRESRYQADSIGDNGRAFGLMQVHPRWHYARMERLGVTDLLDPIQNVTVGIDLLDELNRKYNNLTYAIVAYNRGHFAGEITSYAQDVLTEADRIDR